MEKEKKEDKNLKRFTSVKGSFVITKEEQEAMKLFEIDKKKYFK